VGSDREARSDFQLIAGTNRDLDAAVREGRFREDLLARINLWVFRLPGLAERREDVEPNLDYELDRWAAAHGRRVTFSREAREAFLAFAVSPAARWPGNFRDFGAAIERMATLAAGGRITSALVEDEVTRLQGGPPDAAGAELLDRFLPAPVVEQLDRFDRAQLAEVLRVCAESRSLSEAGRALFAVSRGRRSRTNDADRLRKYLGRFGLSWGELQERR